MDRSARLPMETHEQDELHNSVPLPEMGRRWLEEAKSRHLSDPAATVLFAHHGAMDHDTMTALVREVEGSIHLAEEKVFIRKRVVNVLIEALDNMHRHALGILSDASCALLLKDRRGYLLMTGNAVPPATAALLTHRVGILNEMDPLDLREHFLKLLSNGVRSVNGGSGLGLLTMARRSARPIIARTSSLGPYTSFLSFELRVDEGEEPPMAA
jgi:hypothetical protein